jgi:hypothetical protein
MERGRAEIKLCPQRPETPIFAHTQGAHHRPIYEPYFNFDEFEVASMKGPGKKRVDSSMRSIAKNGKT